MMSSARVSRSHTFTSLVTGRIRLGCSSNSWVSHEDVGGGGKLIRCLVSSRVVMEHIHILPFRGRGSSSSKGNVENST